MWSCIMWSIAIEKHIRGQENLRRPIVGDVEKQQRELQTLAGGKETLSDNPGVLRGGTHAQGPISAVRSRARIVRSSLLRREGKGRKEGRWPNTCTRWHPLWHEKNPSPIRCVSVIQLVFVFCMFSKYYWLHNKICVTLTNLHWGICKNGIENQATNDSNTFIGSACFLIL